MNLKFIQIFLLILIVVGIGLLVTQKVWVPKFVGAIVEWENKEAPVPQILNVDTKIDTSGWQTYVNNKEGFEFRYPVGWALDKTSVGSLSISHSTKLKESSFRVISPQDLSSNLELKDQLLAYLNQKSNFTVDGALSIREIIKEDNEGYIEYVSFIRGDQYFVLTLTWAGKQLADSSLGQARVESRAETLKAFNQILHTFKLTK